MTDRRVFRIRFERDSRVTFSDGHHDMTIRRRRDRVREDTVRQLSRALGDGTLVDPDALRLLGLNLYELLFFNAHANEWFEQVFESATDLRLELEFPPDAADLMAYPWEFLYVPKERWKQGGRYLVTQGRLSLIRRVRRRTGDPLQVDSPRFLVVDCLPPEAAHQGYTTASEAGRQSQVAPNPETDQLMAFLEKRGTVRCLRFPTCMEISAVVEKFEPDVVHVIGHGRFQAGDDASFELCLCPRDAGLELWEKDERIAEAIGARVPELVVLQTCKGGKADRYERYEGAAITLVKQGVPNVVGLQHDIPLKEATRFVTTFYESLARGRPVDVEQAVREGRLALRSSGSVSAFGLPVTYVQRQEGFSLPRPKIEHTGERIVMVAGRDPRPRGAERVPAIVPEPPVTASAGAAAALQAPEPGRAPSVVPETEQPPAERRPESPLSVRLGRKEP